MSTSENLLTEEEAAERIGRTRHWLRRKRLNVEGPAFIPVGVKIHYDLGDLDAWLNSLKQSPGDKKHE